MKDRASANQFWISIPLGLLAVPAFLFFSFSNLNSSPPRQSSNLRAIASLRERHALTGHGTVSSHLLDWSNALPVRWAAPSKASLIKDSSCAAPNVMVAKATAR